MNKISNQSGIEIIACGQHGSAIRCKMQFDITFPKLFELLQNNWMRGGLERHTDPKELFEIMDNDKISKEDKTDLYKAVYFYFTEWIQNNERNN